MKRYFIVLLYIIFIIAFLALVPQAGQASGENEFTVSVSRVGSGWVSPEDTVQVRVRLHVISGAAANMEFFAETSGQLTLEGATVAGDASWGIDIYSGNVQTPRLPMPQPLTKSPIPAAWPCCS